MLELLNLEHATINGRTSKVKFTLQNEIPINYVEHWAWIWLIKGI